MTAQNWTPVERVGLGFGIVIFAGLVIALVPAVRRFVVYEYEVAHRRLFLARSLALLSFSLQCGDWLNNIIQSTNDDLNCIQVGCGNSWKDADGDETHTITRYLIMKGAFASMACMLTQQSILWAPAALRGITLLTILLIVSGIQWFGWYLPFAFGAGPYRWDTELYKVAQILPMVAAIALVWPFYRYNDTVWISLDGDEADPQLAVPDSFRVGQHDKDEPDLATRWNRVTTEEDGGGLSRQGTSTLNYGAAAGRADTENLPTSRSNTMGEDFFRV
eukprot:TRINITY_DN32696_c0_g1_i3.p1 TRINITY_DN32696_c0_g1~~TRINITY_DN32696_c0_g1_i3.p1  ORF type:complete len:276 (+),score=33.38 TRINITY_DN32696_c0_g1_i3:134-961(+)